MIYFTLSYRNIFCNIRKFSSETVENKTFRLLLQREEGRCGEENASVTELR